MSGFGSGGGTFGGFGSNSNSSNPFGASTGFGSTNNNTNTGGFGASFGSNTGNTGGFGAQPSNTGSTFGGFGASTNQPSGGFGTTPSKPLFGNSTSGGFGSTTNQPSAFGGFGSNSTPAASSGFGGASTSTGGGMFGQPNNQPSTTGFGSTSGGAFGSGQSGFGSNATNTNTGGFGASGGFGATATPQNNGTGTTPFQPYTDKDGNGGQQQVYQSISCQDPYKNFSFEELRVQDYIQGRKHGNTNGQAGGFGQSTGFGGTNTANTGTPGFGGTSSGGTGLFGGSNNTANQNTSSPFGGNQTNTGGFGASNTGGLFGQNNQTKPGGLFGSTPATSGQQGGGLFGSSNSNTSTAFGGAPTGGGLFGAKPATGGFGTSNTSNAFGQTNNNTSTGGGMFGSAPQNQQSGSTPFGQSSTQQNGTGFGGFGQTSTANNNNNNNNNQSGGSLFGNTFGTNQNAQQQKPAFGGGATGGLFGNSGNNSTQQPQPSTGLFGLGANNNNNNITTNNAQQGSSGLFGAKPATGTSNLFGSTNAGNNLFGNTSGGLGQNQNQGQQNQGSSLFGSKPLGTNNNTGGGLFSTPFGQNNNNNNNQQTGGSLFGASQNNQQPSFGSSLFNNSQQGQQQGQQQQHHQQGLTTSINSNTPYGNTELFASLATPQQSVGPLATPLSSSQKQRKPAPLAQWKFNPAASSRLITPQKRPSGYGFSYSNYGTPGSALSSPASFSGLLTTGSSNKLSKSLSTSNLRSSYGGGETVLNPDAFSPSPRAYKPGGSLKKLSINRNLRTDLFGGDPAIDRLKASPLKRSVTFDENDTTLNGSTQSNGDSTAVIRVEDHDEATPGPEVLGLMRSTQSSLVERNNETQARGDELAVVPEDGYQAVSADGVGRPPLQPDQLDKEPLEYWMSPTKKELEKMSRQQRRSLKDFVVGRKNAGQIQFGEVNLEGIDLDDICGNIVQIEVRSASVYPNGVSKPPVGKGLNVPSRVTLENSWPRARAGRIPVYERKGKRFEKHVERLQRVTDTVYVDYDPRQGRWTFDVAHFSTYELRYDDDDDDDLPNGLSSSLLSSIPPDIPTPKSATSTYRSSARSQFAQQDSSMISRASLGNGYPLDDTFELRKSRLPGAFDEERLFERHDEPQHDFGSSLVGDGVPMQQISKSEVAAFPEASDHSSSFNSSNQSPSIAGLDGAMDMDAVFSPSTAALAKPKSILKASTRRGLADTPSRRAMTSNEDWAGQLQRTISPKKQDRQALRQSQGAMLKDKQASSELSRDFSRQANPFATSLDVMKSLFGSDSAASKKQAADEKGFKV